MAIYHLTMKPISRSAGRSAVASAAYRSGEKLEDPRQGLTFDYGRKERIIESDIVVPTGSPQINRQELWGSVELHHKRGDAVTAREIEIALPHELNDIDRFGMVYDFANYIADCYGVAVDFSIHSSESEKNYHAHLMLTTVSYGPDGLGKKVHELDPIACDKMRVANAADELRADWANLANEYLVAWKVPMISHLSLADQGIEHEPMRHVGLGLGREEIIAYNENLKAQRDLDRTMEEINRMAEELNRIERELTQVMEDQAEIERRILVDQQNQREIFRIIQAQEKSPATLYAEIRNSVFKEKEKPTWEELFAAVAKERRVDLLLELKADNENVFMANQKKKLAELREVMMAKKSELCATSESARAFYAEESRLGKFTNELMMSGKAPREFVEPYRKLTHDLANGRYYLRTPSLQKIIDEKINELQPRIVRPEKEPDIDLGNGGVKW